MDLTECKRKGIVRKSHPNTSLAKSLLEISSVKEKVIRKATLDEENVLVFLPAAYDSLRGALEAFCILKGYKTASHVCLGELVKTLDPDFDFYSFDRFRYTRNSINYYGTKAGLEESKGLISKMLEMKKQMAEKTRKSL